MALENLKVIEMAGLAPAPMAGMILAGLYCCICWKVVSRDQIASFMGKISDLATRGYKPLRLTVESFEL